MAERVIRKIERLLEQEHQALLNGALDQVASLAAQKEQLLRQISSAGLTPDVLSQLSLNIARNQTLLTAAAKGVRSAEVLMKNLQQAEAGTVVYDKSGTVSRMQTGSKGLSQKL